MNYKAQATIEYMVIIAVVVAALIGMQAYFRRGLQGRLQRQADGISGEATYAPGETSGLSERFETHLEESSSAPKDNTVASSDTVTITQSEGLIHQESSRSEETMSFKDAPEAK